MPPGALADLGRNPAVRYLRAPARAFPDATQGEGVDAIGAGLAHQQGVSGDGVRVAVIDTTFAGYATRQAEGELPGSLTTQNYCNGGFTAGSGHGTGVAEIVHEVAPAAQLYLVCVDDAADLAAAEQYAVAQGVRVVNMSLSFYNTSRGNGSGIPGSPDATVEDARARGIFWANSAGNAAREHWGGQFRSGGGNANFHDWTQAGDETNDVTIGAGQRQCFFLKWDDWPTTNQNFGLYLYPSGGGGLVASSDAPQTGSQPPTEGFCYTNPGATASFGLAVYRNPGTSSTPRLDLYAPDASSIQYPVAEGSVTEPGSAPEAAATGAYCVANQGLESFSSQGPTIDGRMKPNISGPDRVSNATFGLAANCVGGFGGTSASSPHLAGAAALTAQGVSAGPERILASLANAAVDLGAPGADDQFGAGAINLAKRQPDLSVKGRHGRVGADSYSDLSADESAGLRNVRQGAKRKFTLTVQNDGPLPGAIVLTGDRKSRKVSVNYFRKKKNVTKKVTRHGFVTDSLPLDGAVELKAIVKARRNATTGRRSFAFEADDVAGGELVDTAEARLKVKKRKRR